MYEPIDTYLNFEFLDSKHRLFKHPSNFHTAKRVKPISRVAKLDDLVLLCKYFRVR